MAHNHIVRNAEIPDQYDYTPLLNNYEKFGDVWSLNFQNWWYQKASQWMASTQNSAVGQVMAIGNIPLTSVTEFDLRHSKEIRAYGLQLEKYLVKEIIRNGFPDIALITMPLNGDRKHIQNVVRNLVDKQLNATPNSIRTKKRVMFLSNKIRQRTLEKYLYTVHEKARGNLRHWEVYKAVKDEFGPPDKESDQDNSSRMNSDMTSETSTRLKKALIIAEQAAVGVFPTEEKRERLKVASSRRTLAKIAEFNKIHASTEFKSESDHRAKLKQYVDDADKYDISFDLKFIRAHIHWGKINRNPGQY